MTAVFSALLCFLMTDCDLMHAISACYAMDPDGGVSINHCAASEELINEWRAAAIGGVKYSKIAGSTVSLTRFSQLLQQVRFIALQQRLMWPAGLEPGSVRHQALLQGISAFSDECSGSYFYEMMQLYRPSSQALPDAYQTSSLSMIIMA
jgi:hypothetical protein